MLLLTGATGQVGGALLRMLLADGIAVRCLVRDPRRLGALRVRVQIAIGDLADPPSFRNAMRGIDTVVHLAASLRDQRSASIEELNSIATWRIVEAAREAGAERFLFFSALGASTAHRARFFRAKALAERAVEECGIRCVIFAPSLVYAPKDRWLSLLERLALLPVMPLPGDGRSLYQPLWAQDAARCVAAALRTDLRRPAGSMVAEGAEPCVRYELAGPETLSHEEIVAHVLSCAGKPKRILHVPAPVTARALTLLERGLGERAPATWDEAELMQASMISKRGCADVQALGVSPARLERVLGCEA